MLRKTTFLLFALIAAVGCSDKDAFEAGTVATVSGIPIGQAEFLYVMRLESSSVAGKYMAEHKADFNDDFWEKKHGNAQETPLDVLKATALAELEKTRHMQFLALKFGVIDEIKPFQSLEKELAAVNAERARTKAADGVVYGPVQYTFDAYYRMQYNNLEFALKKHLAEKGNPWFSDTDVRAQYEKTGGGLSYDEAKYGILRDLCEQKVDELIEDSSGLVETKINRALYNSLSL